FVSSFETEWLRLRKLCGASKDSYRVAFSKFLDEDKAKRDFLLGFLVRHHKNVVDNLSTKDNLSFADGKQRLQDLDSETPSTESALSATQKKKKNNNSGSSSSPANNSSTPKSKECTWCKKHHPTTNYKGTVGTSATSSRSTMRRRRRARIPARNR